MNWNRITIGGRAYVIEASAGNETLARKRAQQMGCKFTRDPRPGCNGYIIIRPTVGPFGQPDTAFPQTGEATEEGVPA